MIVRIDGSNDSPDLVRPEFLAVKTLRVSLAQTPILVLVNRVPSELEKRVLKECNVNFVHLRVQARIRSELITMIEALAKNH